MNAIMETILKEKLVIIARGIPAEKLVMAAQAMHGAGIVLLESTFDHSLPDPIADNTAKLKALIKAMDGKMAIGAGTVLTVKEVQAAHDAGCGYIISPSTNPEVVAETKRLSMLSIPGAMTPTEIMRAWDLGADMVKLFPADDLGVHYIRNIRAPLPHVPLMATGGVNPATVPEFLQAGINALGTGITVLRRDLVEAEDYLGIAALARAHAEAVRGAEGKKA